MASDDIEKRLAGLRDSAGVWADRDDIGDTIEWLQSLQSDPEQRARDLWNQR